MDSTAALAGNHIHKVGNEEDSTAPNEPTQSVDDENIEHRKRKHRVGVDPSLARWLWKDPKRVPKAREDIARWTNYIATEMSNPAFEILISMASNLRNNRQHSPKNQDD